MAENKKKAKVKAKTTTKKKASITEGKTRSNVKESSENTERPIQPPPPVKPQVPPRTTPNPVVAPKASPAVEQAANVSKPKFGPEEISGLKFGFELIQELKSRAGYDIKGVGVRHHEFEFLTKMAIIAVQRTNLANDQDFKIRDLESKIERYEKVLTQNGLLFPAEHKQNEDN